MIHPRGHEPGAGIAPCRSADTVRFLPRAAAAGPASGRGADAVRTPASAPPLGAARWSGMRVPSLREEDRLGAFESASLGGGIECGRSGATEDPIIAREDWFPASAALIRRGKLVGPGPVAAVQVEQ